MRLALAGDTMLGRNVAKALADVEPASLVAPEVVDVAREADLFVLNLECCVSERGSPWPDPHKPFFFRAPPNAVELLVHLGVDCVTLANNHALDFGPEALLDTLAHLRSAGIVSVGAGSSLEEAQRPALLEAAGSSLAVIAAADHPENFAAGADRPGIVFADLRRSVPDWLLEAVRGADAEAVLVTPHWGFNMESEPSPHVREAGSKLVAAGATLVAGHSAHVFQGVKGRVLYDLGDFLDDYARDPVLRNDLGLLFLVDVEHGQPTRLEAVPLGLEHCFTRLAEDDEAEWIRGRFGRACAAFGTEVEEERGRLVVRLS